MFGPSGMFPWTNGSPCRSNPFTALNEEIVQRRVEFPRDETDCDKQHFGWLYLFGGPLIR